MDVVIPMPTFDAETLGARNGEAGMLVLDDMSPVCIANGYQSRIGRASCGAKNTASRGRGICVGSGAAGDFYAATVRRAPTSTRSMGCELLRSWMMAPRRPSHGYRIFRGEVRPNAYRGYHLKLLSTGTR
jgi:hypothetical protein